MNREKYTKKLRETTVSVVQSRIDSVKRKDVVRTGLRMYDGSVIGVAGAIGSYRDGELQEKARKAMGRGITYPWELSGDSVEKVHVPFDLPDETAFVGEMEAVLEALRSRHPELIFSNNGKLTCSTTALENDVGLDLEYRSCSIAIALGFKHRDSTSIMDGFTGFSGAFSYNRDDAVNELCRSCEAFGKPAALPEGLSVMPIVFSAGDPLFMGKLRSDLNGHQFGTGSSLLQGKIGQKLFDEKFSVTQTDDHMICPSRFFDAEGVVNDGYRYPLIENGKLLAVYTDRRTSDRFDLPLTGAAGAVYDGVPVLAPPDLRIEDTGKTLKELLNGEQGIFIVFAIGGDFTPQGDFASPVQLSYLFDGEKFIGRLPELQISSSVFDMFGENYVGCSTDSLSTLYDARHAVAVMNVEKMS